MSGCHECGLPGYSDPSLCPVCTDSLAHMPPPPPRERKRFEAPPFVDGVQYDAYFRLLVRAIEEWVNDL